MPYIYKIVNDINNKIYIGKTTFSIERRWQEHSKDYKKLSQQHRPLYSAMQKYGIEHFHISLIEECNLLELDQRERYWIESYNSFINGYNATIGGDGKPYADYGIILQLWQEGYNKISIRKITGYSDSTIYQALKDIPLQERLLRNKITMQNLYSKPVKQLSKDGEVLHVYSSTKEAAKMTGCQSNHIQEVCNNKRKTTGGYKWAYLFPSYAMKDNQTQYAPLV